MTINRPGVRSVKGPQSAARIWLGTAWITPAEFSSELSVRDDLEGMRMPVLNDASATPKVDDLNVTDEISVRHVAFDAPWDWLGAGWRDMWTEPGVSLAYGAVFALAAAALAWGTTQAGVQSVIVAL